MVQELTTIDCLGGHNSRIQIDFQLVQLEVLHRKR